MKLVSFLLGRACEPHKSGLQDNHFIHDELQKFWGFTNYGASVPGKEISGILIYNGLAKSRILPFSGFPSNAGMTTRQLYQIDTKGVISAKEGIQ